MDESGDSEDRLNLYLELMGAPAGSFLIDSMFMTSRFTEHDFTSVEAAAAKGDTNAVSEAWKKMLTDSVDKRELVLEHSVPLHEKRHFFDIVSTPFGFEQFLGGWVLTTAFVHVIDELIKKRITMKLPINEWQTDPNCPELILQYLDQHSLVESMPGFIANNDAPFEFPVSQSSLKDDILLVRRTPSDSLELPYVAIRRDPVYVAYPVNSLTIMESVAWYVQKYYMRRIDKDIYEYWKDLVEASPNTWVYTEVLKQVESSCDYDPEKIVKFFEFCLLTPHVFMRGKENERDYAELIPALRFHRLTLYIHENGLESNPLEKTIAAFCDKCHWMRPEDVFVNLKKHLMKNFVLDGDLDVYGVVLKDFIRMQLECIKVREETPLLGINYIKHAPLPPLHRKIRPDGKMDIFTYEDENLGYSWSTYYFISSFMRQSLYKSRISCPVSFRKPAATFPGSGKCTCELGASECMMGQVIGEMGINIEAYRKDTIT